MISVVVPFLNEEKNIALLHAKLLESLKDIGDSYEIIFVDDGSRDNTFLEIKKLKQVHGIKLQRNLGQTAAFGAGISVAKGDIIVTMDGDLENNPADIKKLVAKVREGFDVASGWRKNRWRSQFITRKIPSLCANWLISKVTGIHLHDHGCSLRAYKREVFEGVNFLGEMHRMLAAYLGMRGAKITEIEVGYSNRIHGKSKYGISRTFRVILDVFAFHFFKKYATRPIHFFGYAGFISFAVGFVFFVMSLWYRVVGGVHFNRTPLPTLVALFAMIGVQFILMGLVAELITRLNAKEIQPKTYIAEEYVA